jgi:predicted ATPase
LRRAWLTLGPGVTFLAGEHGSGKSTLVEGIAVAAGFNSEGGSRSFSFATRSSESALGRALRIGRAPGRERSSFFLRTESYYNVATEIERLDRDDGGPPLMPAHVGVSPHERSHGESFLDLLDEPEAVLSTRGCLAALTRIPDLVRQGSQFVIATHSPILLAVPDARILQIEDDGALTPTPYDARPVRTTRRFLADPARAVRDLLG